jgi:predicted transcriptional regulator
MKQNPQASFIIKPKDEAYQTLVRETQSVREQNFIDILEKVRSSAHNALRKVLLIGSEDP